MKLLLTSAGIKNASIREALVDLLVSLFLAALGIVQVSKVGLKRLHVAPVQSRHAIVDTCPQQDRQQQD